VTKRDSSPAHPYSPVRNSFATEKYAVECLGAFRRRSSCVRNSGGDKFHLLIIIISLRLLCYDNALRTFLISPQHPNRHPGYKFTPPTMSLNAHDIQPYLISALYRMIIDSQDFVCAQHNIAPNRIRLINEYFVTLGRLEIFLRFPIQSTIINK